METYLDDGFCPQKNLLVENHGPSQLGKCVVPDTHHFKEEGTHTHYVCIYIYVYAYVYVYVYVHTNIYIYII